MGAIARAAPTSSLDWKDKARLKREVRDDPYGADHHRMKKEALMKEGRSESMGSPGASGRLRMAAPRSVEDLTWESERVNTLIADMKTCPRNPKPRTLPSPMPLLGSLSTGPSSSGTDPSQVAESTPAEGQPICRRHGMPKLKLMRASMASPFAAPLLPLCCPLLSPVLSYPSAASCCPVYSLIFLLPLAVPCALSSLCCPLLSPVLSHPSAAPCCPLCSLIPLLPLTVPRALSSYPLVYLSFISSRHGTGCAWKLPTMP
ncbi:unnamed protein product [Closterium sp. NIES-64]|nr:unnamed protein product [Closterium sp. NIES-65]CAI5979748.1 unnamed protein product [Closterium sp. NIES-64]